MRSVAEITTLFNMRYSIHKTFGKEGVLHQLKNGEEFLLFRGFCKTL